MSETATQGEGREAGTRAHQERGAERRAAAAFVVCTLASLALAVVYWRGGHPQAEGLLLGLALGAVAYGFYVWAERLLPQGPFTQKRENLRARRQEQEEFAEELDKDEADPEELIGRRPLLIKTLALAAAGLGLAFLFPIRSLGPRPGRSLSRTPWRDGLRLVNEEGSPVRLEDVPLDSLVTVFPEGHTASADAQAVLVRVAPGLIKSAKTRQDWAPEGLLAYSKVCTHAGCPVGLYQADAHQLLCPCHQSAFDVLDGARPVIGPAAARLPQLPLRLDPQGFILAAGDFPEPVGPGYWRRV